MTIKTSKKMIPEWIQKIDWKLLKEQKSILFDIIQDIDDAEKVNALEGIIYLIDAMQDYAVDELEIDEQTVFGDDKEC